MTETMRQYELLKKGFSAIVLEELFRQCGNYTYTYHTFSVTDFIKLYKKTDFRELTSSPIKESRDLNRFHVEGGHFFCNWRDRVINFLKKLTQKKSIIALTEDGDMCFKSFLACDITPQGFRFKFISDYKRKCVLPDSKFEEFEKLRKEMLR